ncbi:MAG: PAS domain-containing sensor histidine kinase [Ignavibacteriaceae bacterium]|nr:PAS domain-containing sensor histidine kinase [Ignavibacteriaceae bacterium]
MKKRIYGMSKDFLTKKSSIVVILIFILIAILGVVSIRHTWNHVVKQNSEAAIKTAKIAASALNGEMIKKMSGVPEDIGTIAYKSVKQRLVKIKSLIDGARFTYLFTKKEGKLYFMADSEPEDAKDYSPPGQEYSEADTNYIKLFDSGEELITPPITDRWGTWVSVLVPIKDETTGRTIAVFGMDYEANRWRSTIVLDVLRASVIIVVASLLLLFLSIKFVSQNNLLKNKAIERKQAEAELKESEEKFRSLSEESPNMIFINKAGRVVYVNKKCQEILGYTRDEFLDPRFNFLDIIAPEHIEMVKENFADRYKGKAKDSYEYALVTKDKRRIETSISAKIINYEGGNAILGIVTDITERKRVELLIQRQNNELQELNATKDKFFSIIAHDLRSPFQGFLGVTEMMNENIGEFSTEQIVKFIGELNKSAQNLYKLLQNLLDWAQLKKGSFSFTPEEFSLSKTVSTNIEQINKRAIRKGITIINEVPGEQKVFADERMINSILGNLLSNAVKFSRKEGKVTVKAKTISNGTVEIAVGDTGIGMSERVVNKLFKIDEKVGKTGTDGELSTGLGLLLCKEFVEKLGGKIWVESEEGKGSTFYFTLQERN